MIPATNSNSSENLVTLTIPEEKTSKNNQITCASVLKAMQETAVLALSILLPTCGVIGVGALLYSDYIHPSSLARAIGTGSFAIIGLTVAAAIALAILNHPSMPYVSRPHN